MLKIFELEEMKATKWYGKDQHYLSYQIETPYLLMSPRLKSTNL
jgi:hypothetical protein